MLPPEEFMRLNAQFAQAVQQEDGPTAAALEALLRREAQQLTEEQRVVLSIIVKNNDASPYGLALWRWL